MAVVGEIKIKCLSDKDGERGVINLIRVTEQNPRLFSILITLVVIILQWIKRI